MKVAILGGGSWGTTLSIMLTKNGHDITLWDRSSTVVAELIHDRENRRRLPGIPIPGSVWISSSLEETVTDCSMIICVVSSYGVQSVAKSLAQHSIEGAIIVTGVKGIDCESLKRMSQILEEELASCRIGAIVAVSGPCFAREAAVGLPTTVVVASTSMEAMGCVRQVFISPTFRVYTNDDIIGVEFGGALKNVVALASGMCDGLGLGDNAKGALMTRGLAEITRLGVAMGARPSTFAGLSGMGDLIATCISQKSRNRYVGEEIGKGKHLDDVLRGMVMVAEGVTTTRSAFRLSHQLGVEMPITEQVYAVLFEGRSPQVAISELMRQETKADLW